MRLGSNVVLFERSGIKLKTSGLLVLYCPPFSPLLRETFCSKFGLEMTLFNPLQRPKSIRFWLGLNAPFHHAFTLPTYFGEQKGRLVDFRLKTGVMRAPMNRNYSLRNRTRDAQAEMKQPFVASSKQYHLWDQKDGAQKCRLRGTSVK